MSNAPVTAIYIFLPIDQDSGLASPSTCIGRAELEREVSLWEFNAQVKDLTEPQLLDLAVVVNDLIDTDMHTFTSGRVLQCHRVRLPSDYGERLKASAQG